ncbi:MAG: monofunctional biosynthetic peptidoglycan transglycosylase [Paludibacteraceae bacterium]
MKHIVLKIILGLFLASVGFVLLFKFVPVYYTPLMLRRAVEAVVDGRPVHFERQWVPLDQVSLQVVRAVVAAEDDTFFEHHGFVWQQIQNAYQSNRRGKKQRGGSSISQQTAKNVFTFGTRTYVRKVVEAYFTVWQELIWGKRRTLEVYLNIVEWGDGIYGIEAAAQHYFGKSATQLSAQQAALLAAVLPSPRTYSVTKPGPYISRRQQHIIRMMHNLPPKLPL